MTQKREDWTQNAVRNKEEKKINYVALFQSLNTETGS